MGREQTGRRGKVGYFNRKNPTCIHCTQAQTQQEAAHWVKAYLQGLDMPWAGPGTSAAPTGHPWSWAAAQPHVEAEGAFRQCRSHGRERTNGDKHKARSAGDGARRAGSMDWPLEFGNELWGWQRFRQNKETLYSTATELISTPALPT